MGDGRELSFDGLTLDAARRRLARELAKADREPADLDARLLLESVTGLDHATLLRDGERPLDPQTCARLETMACRRLSGEPTSRILGHRGFAGLTLQVRPGVLDPREDTEAVVRLTRKLRPDCMSLARILDLGTGSGALLCALLATYPEAQGVGVDRSIEACIAARANIAANGLAGRATIVCGGWSAPLAGGFDLIVANPPYIPTGDLAGLPDEVRVHDPALALDGGKDGFDAYRAILADLHRIATPNALLVVEIGAGMRARTEALIIKAGLSPSGIMHDAGGHERALAADIP